MEERMIIPHIRYNFPRASYVMSQEEEPDSPDLRSLFAGLEVSTLEPEEEATPDFEFVINQPSIYATADEHGTSQSSSDLHPFTTIQTDETYPTRRPL
jgi:hypothetical protein